MPEIIQISAGELKKMTAEHGGLHIVISSDVVNGRKKTPKDQAPKIQETQSETLQDLMKQYKFTQTDLVEVLNRTQVYISDRMTGKKSWLMDEVYIICALINACAEPGQPEPIPKSRIADFFPPLKKRAVKRS
ncbi:MAG: hypothetical protein ACK5LX_01160 [Oscillospiraceae bacterium]